jgi:hypothetical protein
MRYLKKKETGGKNINRLTKKQKQLVEYTKLCQKQIDKQDNTKVVLRKKVV